MPFNISVKELDGLSAVRAVSATLQRIDARLMDHGERVGFMACEIADEYGLALDDKLLLLLSVFHDIGAYKTDEIDRMVEFETEKVENHAVYGYLFLKYMSPLSDVSEAILYHHTPWSKLANVNERIRDYAALIHLADRMDILYLNGMDDKIEEMLKKQPELFRPDYIELALDALKKRRLFERLRNGEYSVMNRARIERHEISADTALEYLKMLVFAIDFRSEYTVTHTVNTVSIALDIAASFGLDEAAINKIYLGALLHDVGKIAVPVEILEYPGRLDARQMDIMRTHVIKTDEIINGVVPQEIRNIAIRHHEKLDGSGYPYGLTADELDLPQRIVAVADIVSALMSKRSYKEPFNKDKTIEILRGMSGRQLDGAICDYLCDNFDSVTLRTDNSRNAVIQKYRSMLDEYGIRMRAISEILAE